MLTICVLSDLKNNNVGMYKKYINRAINPVFFAFKHLSQQVTTNETRKNCLPTLIFTIKVLNVQAQDISLITLNHLPAPNAQATNHTAQAEKIQAPIQPTNRHIE